jgi:hypothetical protein
VNGVGRVLNHLVTALANLGLELLGVVVDYAAGHINQQEEGANDVHSRSNGRGEVIVFEGYCANMSVRRAYDM